MVKIHELEKLAKRYGYDASLAQIILKLMEDKPYRCPKCKGTGIQEVTYNAYPNGLPDSTWVYKYKTKTVDCDLCNGEGYTSVKYRPNMVQQGYINSEGEIKC